MSSFFLRGRGSVVALFLLASACDESEGVRADVADTPIQVEQTPSTEQPPNEPMPLPSGSREYLGIVNLVDSSAATALAAYMLSTTPIHPTQREGLAEPVNLFLQSYRESYDFLYLFTDHPLEGGAPAGVFTALNRAAQVGTGNDFAVAPGGYQTDGTLKGVIAVQYGYSPLAHEMMHYWANSFDSSVLGFGADTPKHWGFSSVNGKLGGFNESFLECLNGTDVRTCPPGAEGKIRFRSEFFAPNDDTISPFAFLELYLMGLASPDEVAEDFLLMADPLVVEGSFDESEGTIEVEASGLRIVEMSEIRARHGTVTELPAHERAFHAAFVVLSAEPASDEVMQNVAHLAAVFGGREEDSHTGDARQFATQVRGRASLDTMLGHRRDKTEAAPEPRVRFDCDVVAQDCKDPGQGCYGLNGRVCAISELIPEGGTCVHQFSCAPGFDCVAKPDSPEDYRCQPYCDAEDTSSPKACSALCPGNAVNVKRDGELLLSICTPD